MRPRLSVVLLVLLLTAGTVSPAVGGTADVNDQVCPVCGPAFEMAAADVGVDVAVVESDAVVEIQEDGRAVWTVRNRLANASNARRLADVDLGPALDAKFDAHVRLDADRIRDVSTRVEGDTVVVEFTDPGAGSREFGLTVVTYFRLEQATEQRPGFRFGADRVTVVAPDGTRLTDAGPVGHDVGDARVEDSGRRVVWSNATAGGEAPYVDSVLAFGRYEGPGNALLAAQDYGPLVRRLVLPFNVFGALVLVPAALVFALAVALTRGLSLRDRLAGERGAAALGVVAFVTLVHPYLPGIPTVGPTVAVQALGAVYGALVFVLLARDRGVADLGRRDVLVVLAVTPLAALGWALGAGLAGLALACWLSCVGGTFALGTARTRREHLVAGGVAVTTLYAAIAAFGLRLELYGGGIGGIGLLLVPWTSLGASLGAVVLYPFGTAFDGVSGSEGVAGTDEA